MEHHDIDAAAERASQLVESISAEFRGHAFQVLFEAFLNERVLQISHSKTPHPTVSGQKIQIDRRSLMQEIMSAGIDFSPYHHLLEEISMVSRVILILYILEKELGVKGLTPPELAVVMRDKLRFAKVYAPNIGRAITHNLEFFIRSQEGQAYKYSLSSKGLLEAENLMGSLS